MLAEEGSGSLPSCMYGDKGRSTQALGSDRESNQHTRRPEHRNQRADTSQQDQAAYPAAASPGFRSGGASGASSGLGRRVSIASQRVMAARARTAYKHVPHREKPPHLVARRNARERRRVQAVNNAFVRLRRHIPYDNKHKRLSKVKTLQVAIDYIRQLDRLIQQYDNNLTQPQRYLHNPQHHQHDGMPSRPSTCDVTSQLNKETVQFNWVDTSFVSNYSCASHYSNYYELGNIEYIELLVLCL